MERNDSAHGFDHIEQVVENARRLSSEVECDPLILFSAAYFHDVISRFTQHGYSSAVQRSAELAGDQLRQLGVAEHHNQRIQSCIRTASWEFAVCGGQPDGIEAYVLRDADLLEATGAHGIARVFAFAGTTARPLRWCGANLEHPPRLTPNLKGADESPFHHFFSKLLWLDEFLYTEVAKREAIQRRDTLLRFLREYRRELTWAKTEDVQDP
jgi:uncharacterized protein